MKLLNQKEFEEIAGAMMPLSRNMNTFNGDEYECACGNRHIFNIQNTEVISEGMNGKFLVICPDNTHLASLIQTKMKWGILYQGLELLAGCEV